MAGTINLKAISLIDVNKETKAYIDKLKKSQDNSFRSWDNCRRVFRRAAYMRNPNSADLPTLPECKCNICGGDCKGMNCRLCNNSLALNLAFYLASWGMYRSSFIKKFDHTIHIGAVKILMEVKYLELFDPYLVYNNSVRYKELVKDVYERLLKYYQGKCKGIGRRTTAYSGATDTLITKILLGVYGCIPAYDTYFTKGLGLYGGYKSITFSNLDKVLDDLINIAKILERKIKGVLSSAKKWDKCELYTPMKIIDMTFWCNEE